MAERPGYKSRLYGTLYDGNDDRLVGYGNPPNDPEFQANNPGAGTFPLAQTVVDDDGAGGLTEIV